MNPDLYKRALDFAATRHGTQQVPGKPYSYVVHLTKVAMETMLACAADPTLDADLAVACALLHDSMEDAGVTVEELTADFGADVAAGVRALTKDKALPKELKMADSLGRIAAAPREVQVVKLADRITNLEPPPSTWPKEKPGKYLREAEQILAALKGASAVLEARFVAKMDEYRQYC